MRVDSVMAVLVQMLSIYMSCCREKAAAVLWLERAGIPKAPVLHSTLEVEKMFLLFGWKTKDGI